MQGDSIAHFDPHRNLSNLQHQGQVFCIVLCEVSVFSNIFVLRISKLEIRLSCEIPQENTLGNIVKARFR